MKYATTMAATGQSEECSARRSRRRALKRVENTKERVETKNPTMERSVGVPLYLQVKNHLLSSIQSGKWTEGDLLPSESELCEIYQVSKITIREAVGVLVREGILERLQGKGTFVRRAKYEPHLSGLFSFTKWSIQNGFEPSTRAIKIEADFRDATVAGELGVRSDRELVRIERLRLADNEPLCLEQIYIPAAICPDIHLKDIVGRPFNDILLNDYGIPLFKSAVAIEAAGADQYTRKLLRMGKLESALIIKHIVFSKDSKIIYLVRCAYRGDKVKFWIEL